MFGGAGVGGVGVVSEGVDLSCGVAWDVWGWGRIDVKCFVFVFF